jgi:hypothetical protein
MWSMSGRLCNPGSDFKRLWQIFLRDAPMPRCEMPSDPQAAENAKAPATADPASTEPAANTTHDR